MRICCLFLLLLWYTSAAAQSLRTAPGLCDQAGHARLRYVWTSDTTAFRAWLRAAAPDAHVSAVPSQPHTYRVWVPAHRQPNWHDAPGRTYLDHGPRQAQPEISGGFIDIRANGGEAAHHRWPAWRGQSTTVAIRENPFDTADIDFRGRIQVTPALATMSEQHATIMATLVAGGGNSGPEGTGMAPQASLRSTLLSDLLPTPADLLAGVDVQNHSYGVGLENYYGTEAAAYDQQAQTRPDLLHVFSAGNAGLQTPSNGPWAGLPFGQLTGQFKNAKNVLLVAATSRLGVPLAVSSRGPTQDGRVKPELAAFGDGGTSESAAIVSGISLLLKQALAAHTGPTDASLIKALLINGADADPASPVNYVTGFGRANAVNALRQVEQRTYAVGTVAQGATQTHTLTLTGSSRLLKVTLVWLDPPATPGSTATLTHDLDLRLLGPGSTTWLPWVLSAQPHADSLRRPAQRGIDRRNNVEQVTLANPAAGTYTIEVSGNRVSGSQRYALVWQVEPSEGRFTDPEPYQVLDAGRMQYLRWWQPDSLGTAVLRVRSTRFGQWDTLATAIRPVVGAFEWNPSQHGGLTVAELVGPTNVLRDTFYVLPTPQLRVGYDCPGRLLLTWNRIPDATAYQILRLGSQQLSLVTTITDTLYRTQGRDQAWAVRPLFGSVAGPRSVSVVPNRLEAGCGVSSLQAEANLTARTVALHLTLGTLVDLAELRIERANPNAPPTPLLTVIPDRLTWTLTDPAPRAGTNLYRAQVRLTTGEWVPGPWVPATLPGDQEVWVYPNPVAPNATFNVVWEGAGGWLELYDRTGRRQSGRIRVQGQQAQLAGRDLPNGLYLFRITSDDGQLTRHGRLLIQGN